jgi:Ni,Fe-hydrogenase III large subunit
MSAELQSGRACSLAGVERSTPETFRQAVLGHCASGGRLSAVVAWSPRQDEESRDVLAVTADDARGHLRLTRMRLPRGAAYPALCPELPQAQAFERELCEDHGIRPEGHPWLKALRGHPELDPTVALPHPYFRVEGSGVHEVAVGPVHAGVIEPGHFRFQCQGETVLSLEIHLGYQHRGAIPLLLRSPPARRLAIAESIAGDTAVGHALAYCGAVEGLSGTEVPLGAHAVRAIALELERLANHVGDLGALCNDVGYLPGASWFGRLRGEFLNLLMELSGNRFGRGLVVPGGVRFGLDAAQRKDFLERLRRAERDLVATEGVTFESSSVLSRFERTGVVDHTVAEQLGLVGPVGRASGCDRDVRRDHPSGIYRFALIPVTLADSGDVMARAFVRWIEVLRSLRFVTEEIQDLPAGPLRAELPGAAPGACSVCLVEGWRGEIAHVAITGDDGDLCAYQVVDPSFHNWFGLTMALRDQEISDFPLCNKSFNLSYAGHDL